MPCRIIWQQTGNEAGDADEDDEEEEEREQMPKTKFSLHNIAHKIFFTTSPTQLGRELGHT